MLPAAQPGVCTPAPAHCESSVQTPGVVVVVVVCVVVVAGVVVTGVVVVTVVVVVVGNAYVHVAFGVPAVQFAVLDSSQ